MAEALPLQPASERSHLAPLLTNHMRAEVPVGSSTVALLAELLRQVEYDGHRQHVDSRASSTSGLRASGCDIRGVYHCQIAARQALGRDGVQDLEGVLGGRLVVFIVGDEPAAEIRGEHFGRLEVLPCKARLARTRRADEYHERQFGNGQLQRYRGLRHRGKVHSHLASARRPPGSSAPMGRTLRYSHTARLPPAPRRELGPRPLEPVVTVAQPAGRLDGHITLYSGSGS